MKKWSEICALYKPGKKKRQLFVYISFLFNHFSYKDASGRLTNAENDLKQLRPENSRLSQRLADTKKSLEDETLKRVDLQNQLLSAEESMKFENQVS